MTANTGPRTATAVDLERRPAGGGLPDRIALAHELANASLIPAALRKRPADVLLVVEYGAELGLSPVVATQTLAVVDGKVTIPAALAATLARRAGHRLRVESHPDHAVARLHRADDPDYVFEARWDLDRAQAAGLAGKGAWRQYPAQMLTARATLEVVRMGAPEVLAGTYAVEELAPVLTDPDPAPAGSPPPDGADMLEAVTAAWSPTPAPAPTRKAPARATPDDLARLVTVLADHGATTPDEQREQVSRLLGRPVASAAELTRTDVDRACARLLNPDADPLADLRARATGTRADAWDRAHPEVSTAAVSEPTPAQLRMLDRLVGVLMLDRADLEAHARAVTGRGDLDLDRGEVSALIDRLVGLEGEQRARTTRSTRSDADDDLADDGGLR